MVLVVGCTYALSHRVAGACPYIATTPNAIGILNRECSCGNGVNHVPQVGLRTWARCFLQYTQQVYAYIGSLSKVDIQVHAQVTLYILILSRVALVLIGRVNKTLIRNQIDHGVVTELLGTTTELNVVLVGHGGVAESFIYPVYVGIQIRLGAIAQGVKLLSAVTSRESIVDTSLVDGHAIGVGINKLRLVGDGVKQVVVSNLNATAIVLTTLGDDVDGAIGTLVTIQSHSSGILQDGYILNLLGRDAGNVALDTINQDEWRVIA